MHSNIALQYCTPTTQWFSRLQSALHPCQDLRTIVVVGKRSEAAAPDLTMDSIDRKRLGLELEGLFQEIAS